MISLKTALTRYEIVGYCMDNMRQSVFLVVIPNSTLYLWFLLKLHDGGLGLRLNNDTDLTQESMCQAAAH